MRKGGSVSIAIRIARYVEPQTTYTIRSADQIRTAIVAAHNHAVRAAGSAAVIDAVDAGHLLSHHAARSPGEGAPRPDGRDGRTTAPHAFRARRACAHGGALRHVRHARPAAREGREPDDPGPGR